MINEHDIQLNDSEHNGARKKLAYAQYAVIQLLIAHEVEFVQSLAATNSNVSLLTSRISNIKNMIESLSSEYGEYISADEIESLSDGVEELENDFKNKFTPPSNQNEPQTTLNFKK